MKNQQIDTNHSDVLPSVLCSFEKSPKQRHFSILLSMFIVSATPPSMAAKAGINEKVIGKREINDKIIQK
ncbi:MAG: hypothetical protein FWG99_03310 [Treponema sp.]|nr:hypothetical protein [Treponema sp.]